LRYARKALRYRLRRSFYRGLLRLPGNTGIARLGFKAALHAPAPPLEVLLDMVASSECFVTGRFHGICLALLTRTPFLALASNSHKTEGMLASLGMEDRLLPHPEAVVRRLASGCSYSEDERARIEVYLEDARTGARTMFADIAALARAARLERVSRTA
jgi:hypothetical protein